MPQVVVEPKGPKMTRELWESLKANIMRERERKKQELEANAEVERQRKEREQQQKQDSMTLSETREQISKLDAHLAELKTEKHQLFLQLKKVLNEDEMRRRKEASELINMNYHNNSGQGQQPQQIGPTAAQMFLQPPNITLTRPTLYKPIPPQHLQQHVQSTLIPQGVKRSRSPSPPAHNYRFGPFKPPPHAVHAYPHKPPMGAHYSSSPSSQQQGQSSLISAAYPSHHSQAPSMFTYPSSGGGGGGNPPSRDDPPKQMQAHGGIYLGPPSISRGYVNVLHPMDHGSPISKFGQDDNPKYYPPPTQMTLLRTGGVGGHMNLHPSLNIQPSQQVGGYDARNKKDSLQGPISFQGTSSGSITSGYPIRTTPAATSFQGRPPSPQVIYAGNNQQRLSYSHGSQLSSSPHGQQQQPQGLTVARYSIPPGMQRERERD